MRRRDFLRSTSALAGAVPAVAVAAHLGARPELRDPYEFPANPPNGLMHYTRDAVWVYVGGEWIFLNHLPPAPPTEQTKEVEG